MNRTFETGRTADKLKGFKTSPALMYDRKAASTNANMSKTADFESDRRKSREEGEKNLSKT
eukprot:1316406-Amorphochlora_amoeboformis.AAC.1